MIWIGYGMAWLSTAIAIVAALYYTHSINCLWFLVIPLLISLSHKEENIEDQSDNRLV